MAEGIVSELRFDINEEEATRQLKNIQKEYRNLGKTIEEISAKMNEAGSLAAWKSSGNSSKEWSLMEKHLSESINKLKEYKQEISALKAYIKQLGEEKKKEVEVTKKSTEAIDKNTSARKKNNKEVVKSSESNSKAKISINAEKDALKQINDEIGQNINFRSKLFNAIKGLSATESEYVNVRKILIKTGHEDISVTRSMIDAYVSKRNELSKLNSEIAKYNELMINGSSIVKRYAVAGNMGVANAVYTDIHKQRRLNQIEEVNRNARIKNIQSQNIMDAAGYIAAVREMYNQDRYNKTSISYGAPFSWKPVKLNGLVYPYGGSYSVLSNKSKLTARPNRFSSAPIAQMESESENDSLSRLQLIMAYFGGGKVRELAQEYSQFKSALSSAEAVIGANADEMVRLQASAEELGKNTVFTAGQAAEGIKYLGMAGMKTNEIVKVLPETLNLASAGELDLGRAADIATNIMSSFNMEASEFKVAADAIAYAAANSNTNVEQLALGMKYAGPSARAAGVSLKDTTAVLSTLANAGIQASTGGTSLRMVLSSLSKAPTKSAIKALREMGLEFEDVSLKNNELISVINKLAERNMSLGQAIDIFGVRAANSMMALTSNTEKLNQMEKGLDGCAGAAKRIADIKMDNLSGDFTILTSAVSNAVIQFTKLTGAERIARETFQSITKYINATSDSLEKFMKWAGMVPSEVTKVNKATGETTTAIQDITESGKFLNATMQTGVEIVGTIMGMNIANWALKRVADIDLMRGAVEGLSGKLSGLRDLWSNVLHDTQGGFLTNQTGGLSGAKLALAAPMIAYGVLKVGQIIAEVIKTESVERETSGIVKSNSEQLSLNNTVANYDQSLINSAQKIFDYNSMRMFWMDDSRESSSQFLKRVAESITKDYSWYEKVPEAVEWLDKYNNRDSFIDSRKQEMRDRHESVKEINNALDRLERTFNISIPRDTLRLNSIDNISKLSFLSPEINNVVGVTKTFRNLAGMISEKQNYINDITAPLEAENFIRNFIKNNKGGILPEELANESDLKVLSDIGKELHMSLEEILKTDIPQIANIRKLLGADYVAPKSSGSKAITQEKDTSGNGFVGRVMNLFMGAYNYGMRVANPYITNMSKFSDTYSSELTSNQRTRERIGIVNSVSNQTAYDKKMRDYEKELEIRKKIQEADVSEGSEAANLIRAQIELRYQLNELEEKGMERMRKSEEIYRNLSSGIADAVVNAHNLRDAFQSMGDVAVNMLKRLAAEWAESQLYKMFTRAGDKGGKDSSDSWGWIGSAVGGLTKMFGFANGGAFQNGRLTAYARGGIVNRPTIFPMAHGMGLMGEAGAEAVMPLRRTASGDLGVQVSGGSSRGSLVIAPQITINAEGGSKDENKDAAERIDSTVRQALDDMVMNVIIREQRPGGTLYR